MKKNPNLQNIYFFYYQILTYLLLILNTKFSTLMIKNRRLSLTENEKLVFEVFIL